MYIGINNITCKVHFYIMFLSGSFFPFVQNEITCQEIISLAQAKDVKELQKRLCSRMEFGTAGDVT